MYKTSDPIRDYALYCEDLAKEEAYMPVCDMCGEVIHEDYYFDFDGDIVCEDCVEKMYRRSTDDYIEREKEQRQ